ncbi:hypothetical protein CK203_113628 [Vitis vinifera]|uniref:Uncharacterized protein n=1 Tax=Vitis vinifera TaxID=29760 RepID=A0A438C5B2_VITVI|nr:hypothetical protein CK203_113628 [Vitis vinifera]
MNPQIQGRQPQGEGNFKQGKLEQGQQGRFYAMGSQNAESNALVEVLFTSGGAMRLSFSENYYYKNHGIGDFFHDHNHVLIHIHEFGMILHSLQGMIQI